MANGQRAIVGRCVGLPGAEKADPSGLEPLDLSSEPFEVHGQPAHLGPRPLEPAAVTQRVDRYTGTKSPALEPPSTTTAR